MSAEAYQATWDQTFGIKTTIDQTAWATILQEEQSKTLQLYRFAWAADYPDPEDWLTLLFSSDSPYNEQNASIPAADALMKQADGLADMSQRVPLYNQAEQMLLDQVAVCPLLQYVNHYALRTWVKGDFAEDARGVFPNDAWVSGYIARH